MICQRDHVTIEGATAQGTCPTTVRARGRGCTDYSACVDPGVRRTRRSLALSIAVHGIVRSRLRAQRLTLAALAERRPREAKQRAARRGGSPSRSRWRRSRRPHDRAVPVVHRTPECTGSTPSLVDGTPKKNRQTHSIGSLRHAQRHAPGPQVTPRTRPARHTQAHGMRCPHAARRASRSGNHRCHVGTNESRDRTCTSGTGTSRQAPRAELSA